MTEPSKEALAAAREIVSRIRTYWPIPHWQASRSSVEAERRVVKINLHHTQQGKPIADIVLSDGTSWVELEEYEDLRAEMEEMVKGIERMLDHWVVPDEHICPECGNNYDVKSSCETCDVVIEAERSVSAWRAKHPQ